MIELLKKRRSIRKFQKRDIEQDKINDLLRAALLGPSSRKDRVWNLIVITDRFLIVKLSDCRESSSQFLGGAPLVVVITADPAMADTWIEDCTIAATCIQLTAVSLGLGSCWCQVRNRSYSQSQSSDAYIKEVLSIPENHAIECMIGIGYPSEEKAGYLDEIVSHPKIHWNHST